MFEFHFDCNHSDVWGFFISRPFWASRGLLRRVAVEREP
jgi:hypothetical protein